MIGLKGAKVVPSRV